MWRATAYEGRRRGAIPDDGVEIEKGQFVSGRMVYLDEKDREFAP